MPAKTVQPEDRDLNLLGYVWIKLLKFKSPDKPSKWLMRDTVKEFRAWEQTEKPSTMKHILIALGESGQKEVVGNQDNPEILKYFDALGFDGSKLKDETSWCAAFANWVLKQAELPYQKTLNARSFLKLGEKIEEGNQALGDIVVFWRESKDSWKGHVAFYIRETDNWIYCLGGNQSNTVKVSAYPKYRLLEYRRVTNKHV